MNGLTDCCATAAPSSNLNTVLVQLTRGLFAVIDAADADLVLPHKWYAHRGCKTDYAVRNAHHKTIFMHRVITNAPPGKPVDHRDGSIAPVEREAAGVFYKEEA